MAVRFNVEESVGYGGLWTFLIVWLLLAYRCKGIVLWEHPECPPAPAAAGASSS